MKVSRAATSTGSFSLVVTGSSGTKIRSSSPVDITTGATVTGAIGINFVGTSPTLMAASDTAGLVSKPHWNNALGATRTTGLELVNEFGGTSGAKVTWVSDGGWMTPTLDAAGSSRLMKGYLDTSSTSATIITVAGLTPQYYDVYVYADGDNKAYDRGAAYTMSGSGISTATVNLIDRASTNFAGTFTRANNSGGNYVKFTINASGFTITAKPTAPTDGTRRAPVNGIQVVPAAPRSIGINFVGSGSYAMTTGESAGAVPKTHWNNAEGATRAAPLALNDESGMLTTANVTWAANAGWMTPVIDQPGNARLMKGYLDTSNTSVTTVNVKGLSPGAYSVYVYVDGDNREYSRSADYRISGTGFTAKSAALTDVAGTNYAGSFQQAAGDGGNYVLFTANGGDFTLTATAGASTNATRRAPINAIQIVPR